MIPESVKLTTEKSFKACQHWAEDTFTIFTY